MSLEIATYQEEDPLEELMPHREFITKIISFTPGMAACGIATFVKDRRHFSGLPLLRAHQVEGALKEIAEIAIRSFYSFENLRFLVGRTREFGLPRPIIFLSEKMEVKVSAQKIRNGAVLTLLHLPIPTKKYLVFYGLVDDNEIIKKAIFL